MYIILTHALLVFIVNVSLLFLVIVEVSSFAAGLIEVLILILSIDSQGWREREREREGERQRETERDRETERERGREGGRKRGRQRQKMKCTMKFTIIIMMTHDCLFFISH